MEYKKSALIAFLGGLWIVFCCLVVIVNYQPTGHKQLLFQFLGIAGILVALYLYNRKNK